MKLLQGQDIKPLIHEFTRTRTHQITKSNQPTPYPTAFTELELTCILIAVGMKNEEVLDGGEESLFRDAKIIK